MEEDGITFRSDVNTSTSVRQDGIDQFRLVVNVILMGLLSVFGLLCNTLAIVTLQTDRQKMSMTVLLQGLAVSDNVFLAYTLLYSTLRTALLYDQVAGWERHLSAYIVAYVLPFGWMAQTSSIWIMCLVTADRYLAICHPFISERYCSVSRTRRLLVVIWIVAFVFNMPRFFYYHHMAFGRDERLEAEILFVAHLDNAHDVWGVYHAVYHIGFTIVCLYGVPLPVIVVLNVLLVQEIACARARRRLMEQGNGNVKDNIRITLNLVIVVSVFVVCETPDLIASVLRISAINEAMNPVAMCYYMAVKELLLVICSATNFLIYCVFYARFRKLLRLKFWRPLPENVAGYDSEDNTSVRTAASIEQLSMKTVESCPTMVEQCQEFV